MWLLIDNYDSFTHILLHYLQLAGGDVVVRRNDAISATEAAALNPSRIIISPGPETPDRAGISLEMIRHFHDRIPILGVCLGHQAIGQFFGARLGLLPHPLHGKQSVMQQHGHPLFAGLAPETCIARYHSWHVESLAGSGLQVIGHATDDSSIQALAHEHFPCVGVQFHPESILTENGQQMLNNWAGMY